MKLSRIIPLLVIIAVLSFLIGRYSHDPNTSLVESQNRLRLNPHADLQHNELKRVTSPDGVVDAVLAEVVTDVLSANGYAIYIVDVGEKIDLQSKYPDQKVFYSNRIENLELAWREPKFLEIRYAHGDIFDFRNNWQPKKDYTIEVRLVPQVSSFSYSK